jgi:hypothetical protein
VIGVSNRMSVEAPEAVKVESTEDVERWKPVDQEC